MVYLFHIFTYFTEYLIKNTIKHYKGKCINFYQVINLTKNFCRGFNLNVLYLLKVEDDYFIQAKFMFLSNNRGYYTGGYFILNLSNEPLASLLNFI